MLSSHDVERIWEAFFAKYKKTEGDRTSWSASWSVYRGGHKVEMIMTRCPRGTRFRFFVDGQRIAEVEGFDGLWQSLGPWEAQFPEAFQADIFFAEMDQVL